MTVSGNQNQTEYQILSAIETKLREISGLNAYNCYIAAEAVFMGDNVPGDQYVQVVPELATDQHTHAGRGYKIAQVRIVTFQRLLRDAAYQDSERIADASAGVLKLVESIQNKLTQNFLDGKLVRPLKPLRKETGGQLPAQMTGWTRVDRLFEYSHREAYSAPTNQES